jgi:hydroxypyruvate isomerase
LLRLSANLSTLYTELPLLERPAAARRAGFAAVEFQFPYATPARELARACADARVACVLVNIPADRMEAGDPSRPHELGLAGLPGRQADFAAALAQAIDYAQALNCKQLNCLSGNRPAGAATGPVPKDCWKVLVDNVRLAAQRAGDAGIQLLVEALNPVDFPGHLLRSAADTDALLAAVDHPNLALQYDVYHRYAAGEDWLGGLRMNLPRIRHIQISDYPGRHEPGSGVIDMAALFAFLADSSYAGWVGCEYRPRTTTADSFGWLGLRPEFNTMLNNRT